MQARYADTSGKVHGERKAVKSAAKAVGYAIVVSSMRFPAEELHGNNTTGARIS